VLSEQLVTRINRFNAAHAWNHNDFYHRWILRRLPRTITRALDVGCGTGDLARTLAGRATQVEGIDTDSTMIDHARRLSPPSRHLSFRVASLLDLPPGRRYDVITAVAVVHHTPFAEAIRRLAAVLSPGGTLFIVGCYREESLSDLAVSLVAIPANMAIGLHRSRSRQAPPLSMSAPIAPANMTLAAIRDAAGNLLPGFRLRRGLFWRYLLRYTAPSS
jgi:2-polyprenyl-3-methyl-5-hydroxy-6-metoxy-1,4-benzoquinol methylase